MYASKELNGKPERSVHSAGGHAEMSRGYPVIPKEAMRPERALDRHTTRLLKPTRINRHTFQNPLALQGKKTRHLRVGSRIGHCVIRMRKDFNDDVMITRLP